MARTSAPRRRFLQGSAAGALTAAFGLPGRAASTGRVPFASVPVSQADSLVVPPGYRSTVLYAWGDPAGIAAGMPAFRFDASNTADEQALQAGMHHDGMQYFALPYGADDSAHGLLVLNHEYHSDGLLFPDGAANWSAAKVAKAMAASGVSVIEVEMRDGAWRIVRPSRYARRITATTRCTVSGPAAGHDLLRTAQDPSGREVLGTFAGCAHGWTPWGTYLTCEENFQDRFVNAGTRDTLQLRDRIPSRSRARWEVADERFDAAKHPHEPNRFGWVVEIDPFDPASTPVKRTALGRCCHESATPSLAPDGRLAIYTGDDKAFEYIYKFVSRNKVDLADRARNASILDGGTLHVARFDANGSGVWLPLVYGEGPLVAANGFRDQGDVLVRTRMAADAVGGTKMDRPEWIAVHPRTREVVVTLTGNGDRGGSGKPEPDAANPRANNAYGHILRWREAGDDPAATTFRWSILALGGEPPQPDPLRRPDIMGDAFANPDGVRFDPAGCLWVMTDVSPSRLNQGAFRAFGNNQLLMADDDGIFRRFLTGPVGCEITGLAFTPDGRTAFLNIQHPGEIGGERNDPAQPHKHSNWPDYRADGWPRSATIVMWREDGGVVGA